MMIGEYWIEMIAVALSALTVSVIYTLVEIGLISVTFLIFLIYFFSKGLDK